MNAEAALCKMIGGANSVTVEVPAHRSRLDLCQSPVFLHYRVTNDNHSATDFILYTTTLVTAELKSSYSAAIVYGIAEMLIGSKTLRSCRPRAARGGLQKNTI